MLTYPFEAPFDEIMGDADRFVDAIFSCLESEFLVMPKGDGFVEYPVFERGYEALKAATKGFSQLEPAKLSETGLSLKYGSVNETEYWLTTVPGSSATLKVCPAPLKAFPVMNSPKLSGQSVTSKLR